MVVRIYSGKLYTEVTVCRIAVELILMTNKNWLLTHCNCKHVFVKLYTLSLCHGITKLIWIKSVKLTKKYYLMSFLLFEESGLTLWPLSESTTNKISFASAAPRRCIDRQQMTGMGCGWFTPTPIHPRMIHPRRVKN